MGPIECGVVIDHIGKTALEENKCLYSYKGLVNIPPLSFVDDVLAVSECGIKSIEMNAYLNTQFEMLKQPLNCDKCKKLHMGKKSSCCPTLKVHKDNMQEDTQEKYLGDIISDNFSNMKNIKSRVSASIGTISNIMNILREVSLGKFYFTIGLLLRKTIFLSKLLLNAETWINVT